MTAIENCSGDSVTTAGTSQFTVQVCVFIISVYQSVCFYQSVCPSFSLSVSISLFSNGAAFNTQSRRSLTSYAIRAQNGR